MNFVYLNGKVIEQSKAKVSVFDSSYLYGEGVFETLRVYRGKPAFLEKHFNRLRKNLEILDIPLSLSLSSWLEIISDLLKKNGLKETVIRATWSRENVSMFCRPIQVDPRLYREGATLLLAEDLYNDSGTVSGIKSTNYLLQQIARGLARRAGAYETLLRNRRKNWVEGSKTNFFLVQKGVVTTPPLEEGLLPGITRQVVLEIMKEEKIPFEEKIVSDSDLQNTDEIFITGTVTEVMPVSLLKGYIDRSLRPGPTAKKLRALYHHRI